MKNFIRLMLLTPMVLGIALFTSCGDDDEAAPDDPTITLTSSSSDANIGGEVTITGTVTAPGGFDEITTDVENVAISGPTSGGTGTQNFTATYSVPTSASVGNTIAIEFTAVDELGQTSSEETYTITVVSAGAPTISITGNTSADLKRRMMGSVVLNIAAPEGLDELVVTEGMTTVETIEASEISDPSNYTYEFIVPDDATVSGTYVLNFTATDLQGVTTTTAAVFTTNVLAFDTPTIAFRDIEDDTEISYNEGSEQMIVFTVSKDPLVAFNELTFSRVVNSDTQTPIEQDISGETGDEITFTFTVQEEFLDEVSYGFALTDEFDGASDQLRIDPDILTTDGASFLIDDFDLNGNMVRRIRGDIGDDVTLNAGSYYFSDQLRIEGGTTTINAGAIFYAATGGTSEFRVDGGMINIQGTSSNPVIMTSAGVLEGGTQNPGDWIGFRINGEDGVSSGSVEYLRIEYGGTDNAAFRLQDVDELTTIDYVQVFNTGDILNNDDDPATNNDGPEAAIELRGGTVNLSHIVVVNSENAQIRTRDDYNGKMQYIVLYSTFISERDRWDFDVTEGGSLQIANLTMLGRDTITANSDLSGLRLRNPDEFLVYNSLFAEYSNDAFRVGPDVSDQTINGDRVLAHSLFFNIADQATRDDDGNTLIYETDASFMNTISVEERPANAAGIAAGDYTPDAVISSSFDPRTLDAFFQAGSFVGAIGDTDWTLGWTRNADGSQR